MAYKLAIKIIQNLVAFMSLIVVYSMISYSKNLYLKKIPVILTHGLNKWSLDTGFIS